MRLRLVHLEDDASDRESLARALRAEGLDCAVEDACRDEFERAIADSSDLNLSNLNTQQGHASPSRRVGRPTENVGHMLRCGERVLGLINEMHATARVEPGRA